MMKKAARKKAVRGRGADKLARQKDEMRSNGRAENGLQSDLASIEMMIEDRLGVRLGPTSRRVIALAYGLTQEVSTPSPMLTTSFLLFGMVECGRRERVRNSAKFLLQRVNYTEKRVRDLYLNAARDESKRGRDESKRGRETPSITDYALGAIKKAGEVALETTGGNTVHARHLLAGIILYRPQMPEAGAQKRLREMRIGAKELERDFLSFLIKAELDDKYEAWERILGGQRIEAKPTTKSDSAGPYRVPIASFSGDGVRDAQGKLIDRLGIENEVEGMSKLVASKDIRWPLSIGLFGRWGSGKTFFMEMMEDRIREIAHRSNEGIEKGRESAFCRNVVQIKFNAWHYMDANLWASLVTHIFDELVEQISTGEKEDIEKKKKLLFENVESAKKLLEQAQKRYDDAKRSVETAKQKIENLESKRNTTNDELKNVSFRDIAVLAKDDPRIREQVKRVAECLGLDSVPGNEDLRKVVQQSRDILGKITLICRSTASRQGGRLRLLGYTALLVGLPAVLGLIVLLVAPSGWLSRIGGIIVAGLTFLREWAKTIAPQLRQIDEGLDRWQQVQKEMQSIISQKTHEQNEEESRLCGGIERLRELERLAREDLECASKLEQEANNEMEEVKTGRRLYKFIEERSSRREYKDKLGIIALIREDFEGLTKLIRESANDKSVDELRRIDRIVLYIDDLDRCPADRVVEVLQAVHLILGFELFVVVVGVDPRWILHALREEYTAFGGTDEQLGAISRKWLTTPQDYVEKIFQIPFSVRPMDRSAYERLVSQLVEAHDDGMSEGRDKRPPKGETKSLKIVDGRDKSKVSPAMRDGARPTPAAGSPDDLSRQQKQPMDVSPEQQGAERPEELEFDLAPPAMKLEPGEIEFMKAVGDLMPSPRATKRFVNIYRFLLATLTSQQEVVQFKGKDGQPGDYEAVIVMLGILTRFPTQACDILRMLAGDPKGLERFSVFAAHLKPTEKQGTAPARYSNIVLDDIPDWERPTWELLSGILEEKAKSLSNDSLAPFARWAGWVGRFSFQYGRAAADFQPGTDNLVSEP